MRRFTRERSRSATQPGWRRLTTVAVTVLFALILISGWPGSGAKRAEALGAIAITDMTHAGGGTFTVTGTWEPSGNQCWGPGNTFHFLIEVYDDPDGAVPVTGTLLTGVNPAPCNGDYTSPVDPANRSIGGAWPGPGQGGNTFTLGPGVHHICVVLRHVSLSGNDIAASTCSAESIAVFLVRKDFVPDSSASVTASLSCAAGSASPGSASISESSPGVFGIVGFTGDPVCTGTETPIPQGYSSSGTCSAAATTGTCTIVNLATPAAPPPTATSVPPPPPPTDSGAPPAPPPGSTEPPEPEQPLPPAAPIDPPAIKPPFTGSGGMAHR